MKSPNNIRYPNQLAIAEASRRSRVPHERVEVIGYAASYGARREMSTVEPVYCWPRRLRSRFGSGPQLELVRDEGGSTMIADADTYYRQQVSVRCMELIEAAEMTTDPEAVRRAAVALVEAARQLCQLYAEAEEYRARVRRQQMRVVREDEDEAGEAEDEPW